MFVELIIIGKIEITFDRRNEAIISFMRMKQCKYRESEKYSVILGRNSEEKSLLKIDFFLSITTQVSVLTSLWHFSILSRPRVPQLYGNLIQSVNYNLIPN